MPRIRWRISLWSVLLLFVLLDALAIYGTEAWIWFPTGDPSSPYRSVHIQPNGSVILRYHDPHGQVGRVKELLPGSAIRALPIRWQVGTCFGLGLLTLVVWGAWTRRRLTSKRLSRPRFTMYRRMVVIGAISIWLWLSRMEMYWIFCGSLVVLLALLADSRRTDLTRRSRPRVRQRRLGCAWESPATGSP